MKTIVIMNEQHTMMVSQSAIMDERFGEFNWEVFPVPSNGWTKEEMDSLAQGWAKVRESGWIKDVVFLSPIPYLLAKVASMRIHWSEEREMYYPPRIHLFHNDRREKRELPDGRILQVVAKEGWELVSF